LPIAARNESGAERKSGNDRMRSTRSSGISGIVDAVRGEGRTGRVGFVSMLKDRINESESGIGAPFALNGELGPPRFRRILKMWTFQNCNSLQLSYV
jgi:hypothetical protein